MRVAVLTASVLVAAALVAAERPGGFKVIGPGGGGAMFYPTVSPHDANTVLVACDMTGAYITHDAGRSWRMFNLRGTVQFFAFDPQDRKTMYAGSTVLWRSTDNGETWNLVYPAPGSIREIRMNSDHADEQIVAEPDPLGRLTAFAIDPADGKQLYAAASVANKSALWVSRDQGATWQQAADLKESSRHIWIDPRSPRVNRTLLIAGTHSVSVRSSGAWKTYAAPPDVTFTDLSAGFGAGGGATTMYATSKKRLYRSSDAGVSWQQLTLPGTGAEVQAVATSLHHPEIAYVSYCRLKVDGKEWSGVAKSEDGGATWSLPWKEAESGAANVHDAWITERLGPGWGGNPLTMTVADDDPKLSYATDLGRTMRSADGGATWNAVYSRRVEGGAWTTTGLDVTTSYGVHFDPFDHQRQFITYTDIGLFRSEDGGRSWTSSTAGVPSQWVNTTYWLEFDPAVRGRVWSVNSGTHDLPRPKMWRRNGTASYKGGVCRSDDGGKTWKASNSGMEPTAATHILLDPNSPPSARVLYVTAFGRGVYKSTDGGATWTLKNNGITQANPFAWRLARASDGTLYLLLARQSENGGIGNSDDGAIYRSIDGAESWKPVALPGGVNAPNGLSVDPKLPKRLYLAAWARAVGEHGEGGGIYRSEDGGETWTCMFSGDQHVYDVVIDPRDSQHLYASGFESSAWQSTDAGAHWQRIAGFNFKWAQRVVPDPGDAKQIFVTTFGGSVWHGKTDGAARTLDIATPQMQPGRERP